MSLEMSRALVDGSRFETIRYPDDEIRLRADDHGEVQVVEYSSTDRDGPPPHCHEWDEVEYVIEGTAEFFLDGAWHAAGPGSVQLLPAGSAHSVRIPEGEARLLMVTIGAPYDGFARAVAELTASGEATPAAVVETSARFGVRLGGDGAT